MRKKPVLWIALGIAVVLVVGIAVWGKQYYESRYVGSDYYAMVPLDYSMAPEPIYDSEGNEADTGKSYDLTAYNGEGEARQAEFKVQGEDPSEYPQPGSFLRISISKQLVVGWGYAQESEVPQKALEKIEGK